MIKGLHHNAYRCRDSEETRRFYEDFLRLKLVSAFEIGDGKGLHTFFAMDDGSCLAFFEVPGKPFDFTARSRAIRNMEAQEARRNRLRTNQLGIVPLAFPTWTNLGPNPIPNGQTFPIVPVSGRE